MAKAKKKHSGGGWPPDVQSEEEATMPETRRFGAGANIPATAGARGVDDPHPEHPIVKPEVEKPVITSKAQCQSAMDAQHDLIAKLEQQIVDAKLRLDDLIMQMRRLPSE